MIVTLMAMALAGEAGAAGAAGGAQSLVESAWDIVKVTACGNKSNHVAAFQANDNNRMSNKS